MEWKKVKFMQDRVGEDFDGLITSVTKFGFFVELTDLFVEGLVPLNTLIDDRYTFHENTREIIGQHSRKIYRIGQQLRVIVDHIDPVEKKINFAVLEKAPPPRPSNTKKQTKTRKTPQATIAYRNSVILSVGARFVFSNRDRSRRTSCMPEAPAAHRGAPDNQPLTISP